MRSSIFALLCMCLIALSSIQCGKGKDDRVYSRGSTVIVAVSDVSAMLPDKSDADHLVFLALASLNANGELEGRLAESWEHSPDYREWTYHLRTDVFWHDGVPVTAHDLKFTIVFVILFLFFGN
ncbi:MAG: ABC transporter substrate-binding protein [Desulfatiglandales bacterium]